MFQNVSFRRKILLLPALAALGFMLVLALVRLEGRSSREVTDRIENGYFHADETSDKSPIASSSRPPTSPASSTWGTPSS